MSGKRAHKIRRFWLDFCSCFVIPAYTMLFAGEKGWFSTNFSALAVTGETYYFVFLFWGLLVGGYFLLLMFSLTVAVEKRWLQRLIFSLTAASGACLLYGVAIPYLPARSSEYARLHVGLTFGACVLMMLALLAMLLDCWRAEKKKYLPFLLCWSGIAAASVGLLIFFGKVTSGSEVFFTLSLSLLMRFLWMRRVE